MSKRRVTGEESHLERVNRVLNRLHVQRGHGAMLQTGDSTSLDGERIEWRNPLTELIEAEERILNDLAGDASDVTSRLIEGIKDRLPPGDEMLERLDGFLAGAAEERALRAFESLESAFLEWVFAPGPNPLDVVKRLIAFAKQKRPDLLRNASFRDLGELLNETHATMAARCDALFESLPAALKKSAANGWGKTETACRNMAEAAKGNSNRKTADRARRAIKGISSKPKKSNHAHKRNPPRLAD